MDNEESILLLQETKKILKQINFSSEDSNYLKEIKRNTQVFLESIDEIKAPKFKWYDYSSLVAFLFCLVTSFLGSWYMMLFAFVESFLLYNDLIKPYLRYKRNKQTADEEINEILKEMAKIDEILKLREISKENIFDVEFKEAKDVRLEYVENLINDIRSIITREYEEEFKEILDDFKRWLSNKPLNYVALEDIISRCEELYNKVNIQEVSEDRPRTRKI